MKCNKEQVQSPIPVEEHQAPVWDGGKSQGSRFAKWDLTVLVDKLIMSQQCALTSKTAQSNLTSPEGQKRCFFPSVQY